ncbi:hypothetical protein Tco_1130652 [Tanacetum coccineum]
MLWVIIKFQVKYSKEPDNPTNCGLAGQPYVVANLFGSFCVPSETDFARNGEYSAEPFGFRITMPLRLRTMNGQTLEPLNKGVIQKSTCSFRIDGVSHESNAMRNQLSSLKHSDLWPDIRRRVIRCHSHTSVTEINTTSEHSHTSFPTQLRLEEALLAMKDVKLIMLVTDGNSSNWHSDFQAHSITSLR